VWGSVVPNCPLWICHWFKGLLTGVLKLAGEEGVGTGRQFPPKQIVNMSKNLFEDNTEYFSTNSFVDMQLHAGTITP